MVTYETDQAESGRLRIAAISAAAMLSWYMRNETTTTTANQTTVAADPATMSVAATEARMGR